MKASKAWIMQNLYKLKKISVEVLENQRWRDMLLEFMENKFSSDL